MSPSPQHRIAKSHKRQPHNARKPRAVKTVKKKQYPFDSATADISQRGRTAFEWLLHPIPVSTFFAECFETKPIHLHNSSEKFSSLSSISAIERLVRSKRLSYDEVDVTSYNPSTGRRTHNAEGVVADEAWDRFSGGCSLRLRRPQPYFAGIRRLCMYLESFLECVVGANIYLTPRDSQGFAAHFDDVDAVICQIEGRKHWRVYKRHDEHDVLPRRSSVDFSAAQVEGMKCVMDVVLEPGDVLYLPRGAVHQATCEGCASLHVTISFCQRWTWADLLLGSFERAILETAAVDRSLRRSVPLRFGTVAGAGVDVGKYTKGFEKMLRTMVNSVAKNYPVDYAADRMMERFVEGRLNTARSGDGKVGLESKVQLVANGCIRLVVGDDGLPVLVTKQGRQSCLPEEAGSIKFIIDRYPNGVKVANVPMGKVDDRVELVSGLVEMGILHVVK